jgi:XTP/dITP diphosphohydrolase
MKLLIATRNRHKLEEIRAILALHGVACVGLGEIPDAPEVVEDGDTFEANAIKKAASLARVTGLWTLADDSGLEVDALDGDPGVRSARYAGEPSDDGANNRKLLAALANHTNRRARFRCVIALADPGGHVRTVSGACPGVILTSPRGRAGFGYDPLFVPDGADRTFAELDAATKNRISHRARALQEAVTAWADVLSGCIA